MLLSSDAIATTYRVLDYTTHSLRVPDGVIDRSTLLTAHTRQALPYQSVADLVHFEPRELQSMGISILLLTSAEPLQWPTPQFRANVAACGIGLEVLSLGAACRTFNLLLSDARPTALLAIFSG